MLEGARIIQLVDAPEQVGEVTFEQAFGEHSELRGRGRARRQARRMDRINKRRERKAAKQEARQERRNRRVEARMSRKAMKGQAQRDEAMADAENERSIEELQPQEEESTTGYESSANYGEEQAPEELDQDSEAEDSESEFEAGSTSGNVSSFDAESSDATGKKAPKQNLSIAQLIAWHKRSIKFHQDKIAKVKSLLSTGKLPSNEVAQKAKDLRKLEARLQLSYDRIASLQKKLAMQSSASIPVKRSLDAKITPNRIEVPAKSSADGDYNDAEGDDYLGFDAKETIKKNKNVLIGVGVAAAVIIGLHVAGVFKK